MQSPVPLARFPCVVAEHVCEEVNQRPDGIICISMIVVESEANGEIAANVRALES